MNIGYLSDIFPKTSETFVANEISGLSSNHNIRVFALKSEGGMAPPNVPVTYFKKRLVKDGLSSIKAGFGNELIKRNASEHYFRMIAEYFSEFAEEEEILHRHFGTNSIVYYLAKKMHLPYTVTTHAWDIFANERYEHIDFVLRNAAKVITISNFNREFLIKNMELKKEKIEVVRMGIDSAKFASLKTDGNLKRILSVGRLIEKKGFEYAIDAVGQLVKKYPEIEYTIIGSGPLEPELRAQIKRLGLENIIRIKSGISNERLLDEYKKAGLFILPCIQARDGDMDGIPVVLMEAMAMGKVVISTSVSGIPELIEDKISGLLVKPNDPKALSNAMDMILGEKVDVDSMGKQARKKVIEEFNLKDQVSSMNRIFEDVLSGDS
jgi:glycosyltransferase involved in cell wall biosynthesis